MAFTRLGSFALAVLVLSSADAGPVNEFVLHSGNSLLQTKGTVSSRQSDPEAFSIDGAHIVCHSEGCAEVQANLKAVQAKTKVATEKLADCGKHRAQLEKDLQLAAQKRGKAEGELMQCADDRKKLTAELAQCGKDRAAAEKGLAECAEQRRKLEAELRQCAEVDRPTAERKLQACAVERAQLEKQLVQVVAKLKGGGDAKPASRRRRRASKKASLAQTDAEDQLEVANSLALHAEESRLRTRLSELAMEAEDVGTKLGALDQEEEEAIAAIDANDDKEEQFVQQASAADAKETKALSQLEAVQKKSDATEASLEDESGASEQVKGDLVASEQQESDAQRELLSSAAEEATAAKTLLLLSLELQHDRHQEIKLVQSEQQRSIAELKAKLELQEKDDHEDCDETRAAVITAEEKAEETQAALAECLAMKKFIQAKMDGANKAREMAEKGLEDCIANKAKLKAALAACHEKRDATRAKLKECLDRKKVLKTKIAACHTARDSARKKLAECLARKKELKTKIAGATAKMRKNSLLGTDGSSSDVILADMEEALAMLRGQNSRFEDFIKLDGEHGKRLAELANEIKKHSAEEGAILTGLVAADDDETKAQEGFNVLKSKVQEVLDHLNVASSEGMAAASAAHSTAVQADAAAGVPGPPPDTKREPNADKAYSTES